MISYPFDGDRFARGDSRRWAVPILDEDGFAHPAPQELVYVWTMTVAGSRVPIYRHLLGTQLTLDLAVPELPRVLIDLSHSESALLFPGEYEHELKTLTLLNEVIRVDKGTFTVEPSITGNDIPGAVITAPSGVSTEDLVTAFRQQLGLERVELSIPTLPVTDGQYTLTVVNGSYTWAPLGSTPVPVGGAWFDTWPESWPS